jgi:hypothetical protein
MLLIPINKWRKGWISTGYYLLPWLVLVGLNVPYLLLIRGKKANRTKQPGAGAATAELQPDN